MSSKFIELISSGIDPEHILQEIVSDIETEYSAYGFILLYDPEQDILGSLIAKSLPAQFKELINNISIGPYEGACGAAAFLKQPVYVTDIQSDPSLKKYRNQLLTHGIEACWSRPILSTTNGLLGTICLWFKEKIKPNPDLVIMGAFKTYSQLASIALQMAKLHDQTDIYHDNITKQIDSPIRDLDEESLQLQLQKGLEREEFKVHYQPYFTLESDGIGMEALIRWNHPYAGLLSPHAFLGIAEKTGFIIQLEKWILRKSIEDAVYLRNSGVNLHSLSVNISAKQLERKSFPKYIKKLLKSFACRPETLTLEITERFLIRQKNIDILHQLKKLGIQISIDDFGTSYSSLNYLKDLPVDELKIDRSFISDMDKDINKQKIVEMIILLGHQLGLTIVAEGVETEKELQLLKGMNCHAVQGFYFSKPVTVEEIRSKYVE